MLIDSHCHLDKLELANFHNDFELLMSEMQKDVKHFLCIGINDEHIPQLLNFANKYANVECALGWHPCDVIDDKEKLKLTWLRDNLQQKGVIAIGETGLDYYHSIELKAVQQESFDKHLNLANEYDLPVVVHTRGAPDDTLAMLRNNMPQRKAVLHCFTENIAMAREALDLGLYISLSGIVTFKNAKEIQEIAKFLPLDRILIETDAPFLAPVPFRGKTNYPHYVKYVAKFLADLRAMSEEQLIAETANNFKRLFYKTKLNEN